MAFNDKNNTNILIYLYIIFFTKISEEDITPLLLVFEFFGLIVFSFFFNLLFIYIKGFETNGTMYSNIFFWYIIIYWR